MRIRAAAITIPTIAPLFCRQLFGILHRFDRRELDRIYKRFVTLADQIKVVEDRHLLAVIQEEMPALAGIEEIAKAHAVSGRVGSA